MLGRSSLLIIAMVLLSGVLTSSQALANPCNTGQPEGRPCGQGSNECSGEDTCDGISSCLPNDFPAGTPCGDAAVDECSDGDTCDGAGNCRPNDAPLGTECGDGPTVCSAQDSCSGSGSCQPNDFVPGTNCGDGPTGCSGQDMCDGGGTCQLNDVEAGTECGDGPTECSAQDTCDGSGSCQVHHLTAGSDCGDAGADCVNQDTCDGAGNCDDNGFAASSTPCGDDSDTECTDPDSCNGAGLCQDNHEMSGTPCGDQGVECRADDACDSVGNCTDNGLLPEGSSCTDADECTVDDMCNSGTCVGDPDTCGDGLTQEACGEECDDGNTDDGDGCSGLCLGENCPDGECVAGVENCDTCPEDCRSCPIDCGDGITDPNDNEACDDGNQVSCDGCSELCEDETQLPDSDDDGIVDSCDNCPDDSNPDQADLDVDGIGFVCDSNIRLEGALVIGSGKVASRLLPSGKAKGKIILRGVVFDHPPFGGFSIGLQTGMDPNQDGPDEGVLLIRVFDNVALDEVFTFTRGQCKLKFKEGFLVSGKCKQPDGGPRIKIRKHPLGRNVFRFAFLAKNLSILPVLVEKVSLFLTTGFVLRLDEIGDLEPCKVNINPAGEATFTKCREPGNL